MGCVRLRIRPEYSFPLIVAEGRPRYALPSTRGVVVDVLGPEDHIYALIEKAIETSNPDELEEVMVELRVSLKEHIQKARISAASAWPSASTRRKD
jgi:hypothetical protein